MEIVYQLGDENGNRGYYPRNLNPYEVQAAWELREKLKFVGDLSHTQPLVFIRFFLWGSEIRLSGIPDATEAHNIGQAIKARAAELEAAGPAHPPTREEFAAQMPLLLNFPSR